MAEHYLSRKEWDDALAYALLAAQAGTLPGRLAAARCYEGLQDWDKAEAVVQQASMWFDLSRFEWFFWCKRTGKGDVEAARRVAQEYLGSLGKRRRKDMLPSIAAFEELCGDQEAARQTATGEFKNHADPWFGLLGSLAAHDLGRPFARDKLLAEIAERGPTYFIEKRPRQELIDLAAMIREQIAAGKKGTFDEVKFDKLLKSAPPGEPTNLHYFAGRFLSRQGQTEPARKHLMQAATAPVPRLSRILAAAMLLEQGVPIEEVRGEE